MPGPCCSTSPGNIDKIIVGGDSAGGNLSAALALKARDEGGPKIAGQVLIYPGLGGDITKGSYVTQANAPGLATKDVLYYRDIYKGGSHKFAEPLRETNFAGLPPAFIVAAASIPCAMTAKIMRRNCAAPMCRFRSAMSRFWFMPSCVPGI